jgi:hypothetical protein
VRQENCQTAQERQLESAPMTGPELKQLRRDHGEAIGGSCPRQTWQSCVASPLVMASTRYAMEVAGPSGPAPELLRILAMASDRHRSTRRTSGRWATTIVRRIRPGWSLRSGSAEYPLHIVSGHPILRLHSQLCGTKLNEKYRIAGREPALMNPTDAAARNIKDGDVVRLFNDRGQILVGVKVTDDARPGVMRVFEGGWYDPAEPGKIGTLDKYGDANVLSLDVGTSRLAQGNTAQTIVAEAEKFTGTPPDVTVFTAPATAS